MGVGKIKPRERKPSWLHRLCADGAGAMLHDVLCEGCGRYVCQCRDGVWEAWDPGVVSGGDLPVAIVLRRPLTRIVRHPDGQISLRDVCGVHGLDLQGEYLTGHCCGLTPVSTRPYKPHNRKVKAGRMDWPEITYPSTFSRDPWAADMERTLI